MAIPTTTLDTLIHLTQAILASYGAYQSYIAITNLRKYEDTAKKLAAWSSTAEEQLHKTRTTQASGALAITASLVASVALATASTRLGPWFRFGISPAMLIGTLAAREHIKRYWAPGDGKTVGTRVPLPNMEDYNEAQRRTEELLQTLEYLEYGWLASSFVTAILKSK